jgi:uncharacterized protein (DUF1778 family)
MANMSPVLSVRVSPSERDLLEFAAEQARTSLSDFVRRKALEAAEMDVLGSNLYGVFPVKGFSSTDSLWATVQSRP